MPDRTYITTYRADTAQYEAALDRLIAKLVSLDRLAEVVGPKLKALGVGAAAPLNRAADAAEGLAKHLGETDRAAQAAQGSIQAAAAAAGTLPKPAGEATVQVAGLTSSLLAMRAGMFVLHEVRDAIRGVGNAAREAREHANAGAEKGLSQRDKAREYANLVGADGPSDAVMAQLFDIGAAGKMGLDDAIKYGEQFRGSSPAGLQKHNVGDGIRPGETQAQYEARVEPITKGIEQEGAKFSARVGLAPETGGDLAGLVPQYGRTPDAATAAGQLAGLAYGLNEGRGKISTLAKGALAAAATMVNPEQGGSESRVKDLTEMGAIAGVASVGAKTAASAGTKVLQSDRLLQKLAASDDPEVKALGIGDGDTYVDALRKAAPVLTAPGARKWLRDHGFKAVTENDAGIAMARNLGVLDQRIARGRGIAANGPAAMAQNEAFAKTLTGQNREAELVGEKGLFDQTKDHQFLTAARKAALGQLQQEHAIDEFGPNVADKLSDAVFAIPNMLSGDPGSRQGRIDDRARQNLVKSARAAGIDVEKRFPGITWGDIRNGKTLDDAFSEIGPELEKRGFGFTGQDKDVKAGADRVGGPTFGLGVPGSPVRPPAPGAGGGPQAANDEKLLPALDKIEKAIRDQTGELKTTLALGDPFGAGPPPPFVGARRA
jgi:hypothetical protein